MKHEWHISYAELQSIMQSKIRVCSICYAIQEHTTDYAWMRVIGYRWYPKVGRCGPRSDQENAEMLRELAIDETTYWKAVNISTKQA